MIFIDFLSQWDADKVSFSGLSVYRNFYDNDLVEAFKWFSDVLVKNPKMVKAFHWSENSWPCWDLKKEELDLFKFIPRINFNKTLDLIHEKEIDVNEAIHDIKDPNFGVLKQSKLSIKILTIRTFDFRNLPEKLELSQSILDSIENIFVEWLVEDIDIVLEPIDYTKMLSFLKTCSLIWNTVLKTERNEVHINSLTRNFSDNIRIISWSYSTFFLKNVEIFFKKGEDHFKIFARDLGLNFKYRKGESIFEDLILWNCDLKGYLLKNKISMIDKNSHERIGEDEIDEDIKEALEFHGPESLIIRNKNLLLNKVEVNEKVFPFYERLNLVVSSESSLVFSYSKLPKDTCDRRETFIKLIKNAKERGLSEWLFILHLRHFDDNFIQIYRESISNFSELYVRVSTEFYYGMRENCDSSSLQEFKSMILDSPAKQTISITVKLSKELNDNYTVEIDNRNKQRANTLFDRLFSCEEREDYIQMKEEFPFHIKKKDSRLIDPTRDFL